MAKPTKSLELHYPIIHFLIIVIIKSITLIPGFQILKLKVKILIN